MLEVLKILEILQIYPQQLLLEGYHSLKKPFFLIKYCCELLNYEFLYLDISHCDFIKRFTSIIKDLIKNICLKEIKAVIFIDFGSKSYEKNEKNEELWNLLSLVLSGMNISMLFNKKERKELIEAINNDPEMETLKFEHQIYKLSKKLMVSLKFVISQQKNDSNIKKQNYKLPNVLNKNFLKFTLKDLPPTFMELHNYEEELLNLALSEESIQKLDYSLGLELMLSPHFEDFYNFSLLNSRAYYIIATERLSSGIMRIIDEKIDNLKTSTLFGKMYEGVRKILEVLKGKLDEQENLFEIIRKENGLQKEEIKAIEIQKEKFNNELEGFFLYLRFIGLFFKLELKKREKVLEDESLQASFKIDERIKEAAMRRSKALEQLKGRKELEENEV